MLTSSAKLLPTAEQSKLLWKLGDAYGFAVREVYLRCVIGSEAWYVPGGAAKNVRSQLTARGWSQREADSIHHAAAAAQESAVASAKLALDSKLDSRVVASNDLRKAKKHGHALRKRRGKSKHIQCLTSEIHELERDIGEGKVRVCFGGRKLLRATRNWEANGYDSQTAATTAWRRKRSGSVMIEGDRESSYGNPSIHVILDETAARDGIVSIRLPHFITGTACWMDVKASGFTAKHNRSAIIAAQHREVRTDRRRGTKADWDAAKPVKAKRRSANPVSVRLTWKEGKKGRENHGNKGEGQGSWYAHASAAPPPLNTGPKSKERGASGNRVHALAVDENTDHLAYALVDPDGNPIIRYSGRVDIEMGRKAGATISSIGSAVSQIMRLRAWIEADLGVPVIIAIEILNFQQAKAELRNYPPKLAAKLSSFAYNCFDQIVEAHCRREAVELRRVGAAWSSVLGHLNYAHPYGVSIDIAAAIVLGRRAVGMQSKIRPSVQARILACDEDSKGIEPVRVTLGRAKRAVGPRRETWKTSSPLLRRQALAPPTRPLSFSGSGLTIPDRGATLAKHDQCQK